MSRESVAELAVKSSLETTVQEVLDILEADDGKSFEEKKATMIEHLSRSQDAELSEILVDRAIAEKNGLKLKNDFWYDGVVTCADCSIILRRVVASDREGFLGLQREYSLLKSMLEEESYCTLVWNEHLEDKALMLTIEKNGEYLGYCGIKNTSQVPWEIAIELQPQWTKQGIGGHAIAAMLNAIKTRLGVTAFRVRIDPGNTASQKMFERLGAVPNGISEFIVHDPSLIEKCEEENLHLIDGTVIALAERFGVEPRKLLSHILEYTLNWS